jgi:limonene-1,2-epoxide hydrolase
VEGVVTGEPGGPTKAAIKARILARLDERCTNPVRSSEDRAWWARERETIRGLPGDECQPPLTTTTRLLPKSEVIAELEAELLAHPTQGERVLRHRADVDAVAGETVEEVHFSVVGWSLVGTRADSPGLVAARTALALARAAGNAELIASAEAASWRAEARDWWHPLLINGTRYRAP